MKSNIHIITERREGTITEGTIQMGGSATKYINYGKTIVFFDKGAIICQINCEVPFSDFKSQLLTPEDVFASYPLKNMVVIKYRNGNIESVIGYYNRKREGKCLEYRDCKLYRESSYIQDQLNGLYVEHDKECIECEYKNGLKHGKETIKYANGNVKFVGHYIDGKRDGEFTEYRPDGTLVKMYTYKDDKLDGLETTFYENKNKYTETNYRNGLKHGEYKDYNWRGVLAKKCTYKDDKLDGLELFYNDKNILIQSTQYKDGSKDGEYKEFYPDGKPKYQVCYINGSRNGQYIQWFANGQPEMIGNFDSGMWHGETEYYDENGHRMKTHIYRHASLPKAIYYNKSALDEMMYNTSRVFGYVPSGGSPVYRPDRIMRPELIEFQPYEPNEHKISSLPPEYTEPNNILTFMRQISKEPPPPQYVEPSAPPMPLQFPEIPNNQELEEGVVKPILLMD